VYSDIGKFLRFYKSGPVPKAFKAVGFGGVDFLSSPMATTLIPKELSKIMNIWVFHQQKCSSKFQHHLVLPEIFEIDRNSQDQSPDDLVFSILIWCSADFEIMAVVP